MSSLSRSGERYSIVILGALNPAILHPSWFQRYNLLPQGEAEGATVEIVSPQVTVFETTWLRLEATQQRLVVSTTLASHVSPLRDVVAGALSLLSHTPTTAVGLNFNATFGIEDEIAWHRIGHALAPKELWRGLLSAPGMRTVIVEETRFDKELPGNFQINISAAAYKSLSVATNDHYHIGDSRAVSAMNIIKERWHSALDKATSLATDVLERAMQRNPSDYESELIAAAIEFAKKGKQ